jgi:uncharacterized protein YndB with AHSA1/START domain
MAKPFLVSRKWVVINAPPQRVFDYLADMARHREWNPEPGFTVTERPTGAVGLGSVYQREREERFQGPLMQAGASTHPVDLVRITSVTAFRPYTSLAFDTRNSFNGLLHSVESMTFEFDPTPEGTRVTMVNELEAMVPQAFIGPGYAMRLARGAFVRFIDGWASRFIPGLAVGAHLARIKERVEGV